MLETETIDALLSCVETWIHEEEQRARQVHMVPKKKWRLQKSLFFLLWQGCLFRLLSIPSMCFFFLHPRYDAFIASNEAYINSNPSEVITALEPYNPSQMPRVVQYQLLNPMSPMKT